MIPSLALKDVPLFPITAPLGRETQDVEVKCCTLHKTLRSSLDVWEYTPGEFEWEIDEDQSACVLSGYAEVDLADGRMLSLQPGNAVFLPRGLHSHWVVKETLRTVTVRSS
jgi:uncharacterized cupin superfamily protein